jgi:hypothetical protein
MIPAPQLALLKTAARLPGKGGAEARQLLTTCKIAWDDEPKPAAREIPTSIVRAARRGRGPARRAATTVRAGACVVALWLCLCAVTLGSLTVRTLPHASPHNRRVPTASTAFTPRRPEAPRSAPRRVVQDLNRAST